MPTVKGNVMEVKVNIPIIANLKPDNVDKWEKMTYSDIYNGKQIFVGLEYTNLTPVKKGSFWPINKFGLVISPRSFHPLLGPVNYQMLPYMRYKLRGGEVKVNYKSTIQGWGGEIGVQVNRSIPKQIVSVNDLTGNSNSFIFTTNETKKIFHVDETWLNNNFVAYGSPDSQETKDSNGFNALEDAFSITWSPYNVLINGMSVEEGTKIGTMELTWVYELADKNISLGMINFNEWAERGFQVSDPIAVEIARQASTSISNMYDTGYQDVQVDYTGRSGIKSYGINVMNTYSKATKSNYLKNRIGKRVMSVMSRIGLNGQMQDPIFIFGDTWDNQFQKVAAASGRLMNGSLKEFFTGSNTINGCKAVGYSTGPYTHREVFNSNLCYGSAEIPENNSIFPPFAAPDVTKDKNQINVMHGFRNGFYVSDDKQIVNYQNNKILSTNDRTSVFYMPMVNEDRTVVNDASMNYYWQTMQMAVVGCENEVTLCTGFTSGDRIDSNSPVEMIIGEVDEEDCMIKRTAGVVTIPDSLNSMPDNVRRAYIKDKRTSSNDWKTTLLSGFCGAVNGIMSNKSVGARPLMNNTQASKGSFSSGVLSKKNGVLGDSTITTLSSLETSSTLNGVKFASIHLPDTFTGSSVTAAEVNDYLHTFGNFTEAIKYKYTPVNTDNSVSVQIDFDMQQVPSVTVFTSLPFGVKTDGSTFIRGIPNNTGSIANTTGVFRNIFGPSIKATVFTAVCCSRYSPNTDMDKAVKYSIFLNDPSTNGTQVTQSADENSTTMVQMKFTKGSDSFLVPCLSTPLNTLFTSGIHSSFTIPSHLPEEVSGVAELRPLAGGSEVYVFIVNSVEMSAVIKPSTAEFMYSSLVSKETSLVSFNDYNGSGLSVDNVMGLGILTGISFGSDQALMSDGTTQAGYDEGLVQTYTKFSCSEQINSMNDPNGPVTAK